MQSSLVCTFTLGVILRTSSTVPGGRGDLCRGRVEKGEGLYVNVVELGIHSRPGCNTTCITYGMPSDRGDLHGRTVEREGGGLYMNIVTPGIYIRAG